MPKSNKKRVIVQRLNKSSCYRNYKIVISSESEEEFGEVKKQDLPITLCKNWAKTTRRCPHSIDTPSK